MTRIVVLILMMLAMLTGPAWAGEIEFRGAAHKVKTEQGENAIRFGAFMKIDWQQLAMTYFKAYPLTGLSQAQTAELVEKEDVYGNVDLEYFVPLPEEYQRARFVFLSADGFRALTVTSLRATVRYGVHGNDVTAEVAYGHLLGVPEPNNTSSGGFVALLKDGQKLLKEEMVGQIHPGLEAVNPFKKAKVVRQTRYRFASADSAYLFVQFEADTTCEGACCAFRYYLFREDLNNHELERFQSILYGCDI